MKYSNIKKAKFLSRPNRFIAHIEVDGKTEIAHVKNTGRCKELLIPGATIFVEENNSQHRKTKFSLISVYKGNRLINMDSQAPNKIFYEWVQAGNFLSDVTLIKPEVTYKSSRFDFYIEAANKKIFVEVKGVTLEENGVAMFPDAPTQRGVKHVEELCHSLENGYEAYVVFIIQMNGIKYFIPNNKTHKEFGDALKQAKQSGVNIIAIECLVWENEIIADKIVKAEIV